MSLNYASLALSEDLVLLYAAHWAACTLLPPTTFNEPMDTWLGYYEYCISEPAAVTLAYEAAFKVGVAKEERLDLLGFDVSTPSMHSARRGFASGARPELAAERLSNGTCSVRCELPSNLYIAALYMALQLMSGTTGGEFNIRE